MWYLMADDAGHGIHLVNMLHPVVETDPSSIESNVTIYLYTRNNQNNPHAITCDNIEDLDTKWPTVVLSHGWKSNTGTMDDIKNAYLTVGDHNVISVDWSPIAANSMYPQVTKDLVIVGKFVAKLLDCLVEEHSLDLSRVHLAGHSLGAHVVGVIGGSLAQEKKVALLTGLDPAGPGFDDSLKPDEDMMLDQGDAEFVQIIHTNTALLGYEYPMGNADFFPNGGSKQAGCGSDFIGACSHSRSTEYFAESVKFPSAFIGYQCDDWETYVSCYGQPWAVMGAHVDPSTTSGVYYMNTRTSAPFGLGVLG